NEAPQGAPVDAAAGPRPEALASSGERGAGPAGGPPGDRMGRHQRGQRSPGNAQAPPPPGAAPSQ
ncbi:MAG: hypothetical protein WA813_17200, partial [Beijerinckiaceae bacterium]